MEAYNYNKINWEKAYNDESPSIIAAKDPSMEYPIYKDKDNKYGDGIRWNPALGLETTNGKCLSPATGLAHEIDHAYGARINNSKWKEDRRRGSDEKYDTKEERRVTTGSEQKQARANGEIGRNETTRFDHQGEYFVSESVTSNKRKKR